MNREGWILYQIREYTTGVIFTFFLYCCIWIDPLAGQLLATHCTAQSSIHCSSHLMVVANVLSFPFGTVLTDKMNKQSVKRLKEAGKPTVNTLVLSLVYCTILLVKCNHTLTRNLVSLEMRPTFLSGQRLTLFWTTVHWSWHFLTLKVHTKVCTANCVVRQLLSTSFVYTLHFVSCTLRLTSVHLRSVY